MNDDEHPKPNPEEAHPREGGTLPEGAPTAGEAALEKGDVEVDEPKAGRGGTSTHGAGAHDDPSN